MTERERDKVGEKTCGRGKGGPLALNLNLEPVGLGGWGQVLSVNGEAE